MNIKDKTCLFCLKQRSILVNHSDTAESLRKIYNIKLPSVGCNLCVECHFYIGRIGEIKRTIEEADNFEADNCFVCKSGKPVDTPGVDRVLDYLLKQSTAINFGKTDSVKACVACLYLLEASIKYEKLAKSYETAQRFSKKYATLKECNVGLWKIDVDKLDSLLDTGGGGGGDKNKKVKTQKRSRSSCDEGDEVTPKRAKTVDESVLPVILTKLTPTVTPKITPTPGPKLSPPGEKKKGPSPNTNSLASKSKAKPGEKFFIKFPISKKLHTKKQNREKYETPVSPSKQIPDSPSIEDLNKIFSVKLRSFHVRVERVDLSSYLNRTTAHDISTPPPRKKKEEFIGLDEEDVVELQQNNISLNSSFGKRKSILVTERIESPNSAKKKVKFSDSPSIKYVDKLNFSDDENEKQPNDNDAEAKKEKKKNLKQQNGTATAQQNHKTNEKRVTKPVENGEEFLPESGTEENVAEQDIGNKEYPQKVESLNAVGKKKENGEDVASKDDSKVKEVIPAENGSSKDVKDTLKANESVCESDTPDVPPSADAEMTDISTTNDSPNETEYEENLDSEMKDISTIDSPQDVDMVETKSPSPQDVQMEEPEKTEDKVQSAENAPDDQKDAHSPTFTGEFEGFDKEDDEAELEKVKITLDKLLEDSEQSSTEQDIKGSGETDTSTPEIKEKEGTEEQSSKEFSSPNESKDDPVRHAAPDIEENKTKPLSSLDDMDDISDDDDILNDLDDLQGKKNNSPDLLSKGEGSAETV